jgi:hypothetical protein
MGQWWDAAIAAAWERPPTDLSEAVTDASQCKAAGVDTKVISALLGHSRTDFMAPAIGLEPITCRLTGGLYRAERSAVADHHQPA